MTQSDPTILRRDTVAPGAHWSARLSRGQTLRIVDTHGQQAVDFLCYGADLPLDRYNAANTLKINGNIYIGAGTKLYSDHARVLMRLTADSCGRHDTLAGCCSAHANFVRYGIKNTPNCRDNFIAALGGWGLGPSEIVSNVNFFMNVPVRQDGAVAIEDGLSKAGDFVELLAEQDVLAVLSNCPQRNNPAAGFEPTDIEVIVSAA